MATNFPTAIDDLSTSTGSTGQPLSNPNHITAHTNQNDAIEALQTKVGVDSSVDTDSLDYKVAHVPVSSFSDFDVTAPSSNQIFSYNGTKWVNTLPNMKFGGTGADGALTITSGTTTIDCAGAQLVVKNYTSISITGTAKVAFSNPHANGTTIVFKSKAGVTVTSSTVPAIDASAMGAIGGLQATISTPSTTLAHNNGTDGYGFPAYKTNKGAANNGGDLPTADFAHMIRSVLSGKYSFVVPGAGASSGSARTFDGTAAVGGKGGRGGAVFIIECGGAWNVTSTISVAGEAGSNATRTGVGIAGGGGGGGGGVFIGLYNILTANTGTYVVSGGVAGNGTTTGSTGVNSTGGGGGASIENVGGSATGTSGIDTGLNGGIGGNGLSIVQLNTEFA